MCRRAFEVLSSPLAIRRYTDFWLIRKISAVSFGVNISRPLNGSALDGAGIGTDGADFGDSVFVRNRSRSGWICSLLTWISPENFRTMVSNEVSLSFISVKLYCHLPELLI